MKKILVIGATGMVGHILFNELRKKNFDVIGIGRSKSEKDIIQFDLYSEWKQVKSFVENEKFDIIINSSALLVNESNVNKLQAVYINSFLPHILVDIFSSSNTKIVHLSTGGVFSGNDEFYTEDSPLSPLTYYGVTKAAGEFCNEKDLVIRSDFWGPDNKKNGTGIFNWFLNQEGMIAAYANVFFNGISNIELSRIMVDLFSYTGIIHIGTDKKISKSCFLDKIKKKFHLDNINLYCKDATYRNFFLKSKMDLPYINDFDTMIKNAYQYLIFNKGYYANIYQHIY